MSNFYDSIFFDLDGTLWDATEKSAIGWNSALIKENLSEFCVESDDIKNICGLPFSECLSSVFGHISNIDCNHLKPLIDEAEKLQIERSGDDIFIGVAEGIRDLSKSTLFI